MEKEEKKQNKKEAEACPLCRVSDETLEILKKAGEKKKKENNKK